MFQNVYCCRPKDNFKEKTFDASEDDQYDDRRHRRPSVAGHLLVMVMVAEFSENLGSGICRPLTGLPIARTMINSSHNESR
jgi:hypothetical protein